MRSSNFPVFAFMSALFVFLFSDVTFATPAPVTELPHSTIKWFDPARAERRECLVSLDVSFFSEMRRGVANGVIMTNLVVGVKRGGKDYPVGVLFVYPKNKKRVAEKYVADGSGGWYPYLYNLDEGPPEESKEPFYGTLTSLGVSVEDYQKCKTSL